MDLRNLDLKGTEPKQDHPRMEHRGSVRWAGWDAEPGQEAETRQYLRAPERERNTSGKKIHL